MVPQSHIVSRSPGRLRLKVPARKGEKEYFDRVERELAGREGVLSITSNPLTASVLILHSTDEGKIAEFAREKQLFGLPEPGGPGGRILHNPREMLVGIGKTCKTANQKFTELTGGRLDIPSTAFLALLGAGAYQILAGNLTPVPWYNALWYALGIFLALKILPEISATTEEQKYGRTNH